MLHSVLQVASGYSQAQALSNSMDLDGFGRGLPHTMHVFLMACAEIAEVTICCAARPMPQLLLHHPLQQLSSGSEHLQQRMSKRSRARASRKPGSSWPGGTLSWPRSGQAASSSKGVAYPLVATHLAKYCMQGSCGSAWILGHA